MPPILKTYIFPTHLFIHFLFEEYTKWNYVALKQKEKQGDVIVEIRVNSQSV